MRGMTLTGKDKWLDIFAIGSSLLCLVHCLALPLLIAFLPALARTTAMTEPLHMWIVICAVPTSLYALFSVYKHSHRIQPLLLGISGLLLLIAGVWLRDQGDIELYATVLGSGILMTAHFMNWSLRHL